MFTPGAVELRPDAGRRSDHVGWPDRADCAVTVSLAHVRIDTVPFLGIPYENGVVVGGTPGLDGGCRPVTFTSVDTLPGGLLQWARTAVNAPEMAGRTAAMHLTYIPRFRTAWAFAVGLMLREEHAQRGSSNLVITSAKRLHFDLGDGWRALPHRVEVPEFGRDGYRRVIVWEVMSPLVYARRAAFHG